MAQTIKRSFTGGEISPALRVRADVAKYTTGLALCQNMFIRSSGGAYSRQGTKFICELDDSSNPGRLIPFQFSNEQTYVLVFEHLKMRVIKDGELVLAGGGPSIYELVTPYTSEDLSRLQFTQSADVMTIVHPDVGPKNLSRTGHDSWSLDFVDFSPSLSSPVWANDTVATISGATQANPCVITTSAPHTFATRDSVTIDDVVGMVELNGGTYFITVLSATTFSLDGVDSSGFTAYTSDGTATRGALSYVGSGFGSYDKTYSYVVTAVDDAGVESLPSVQADITTKSLSTTAGVRLRWNAVADAAFYRVYKDPSDATQVFGWIGDSKALEFTDYNIAPVVSDAPPQDRNPLSLTESGYPSCVAYYQQRRIYANTTYEPQTVFTSQTGVYDSLRTSSPARADDAVTFAINSKQVNEIRHLVEMASLVILTSSAEYRVTEGQDEVLTPSTVGARKQSNNGASWVSPAVVGDTILYVQEKGGKIRDINYEFIDDKYKGNDLSIMAEHLFEGFTVTDMEFAQEPYGIVWCIRDDGVLLGLTYQREHQVWAWHHHISATSDSDSEFESVTVISEEGRDAPYFIVKRVINGNTVRYVERMEKRHTTGPEDVWCVDSGLRYEGAPATVMAGLDHLEGEELSVVADGNVVTGLVVTSGQITLPRAASKVVAGLGFTPAIELLDIDVASESDTLKGKSVSVSSVIVEVEDTRGMWIGPKKDDGTDGVMYEVKPRRESDAYTAIQLYTGKEEIRISPQWSLGGGIRIEQRSPMPMTILSVIPEIDVS